jgi:hypothetical protein
MKDEVFGGMSDREIERVAQELADKTKPDDVGNLTFDLTDAELMQVDQIQREVQESFFGKSDTDDNKLEMAKQITGRLADIGLEAVVEWEEAYAPQLGSVISIPTVSIIDRIGGLEVDTDHDRKRWDALQRDKSEIPNPDLVD